MDQKPEWMQDPLIEQIDEKKLQFLSDLVEGGKGKSQREIMSYMMQKMKQAKADGVITTSAEAGLIVEAIKRHSSKEELDKIDELMKKAPQ